MLIVYSKTVCPYCIKAKNYLKMKNIDFHEINIEEDNQAREFLMAQGHRTVPQIYYEDYHHPSPRLFVQGGCDGLIKLNSAELSSRLQKM
jgi:glutaredoxin 3